ncbi:MAG: hypothetical protein FWD34_02915 [Oscillospiraceae bacterium]|nr:hypothetical protein [Oscillospiraceae bacterium]
MDKIYKPLSEFNDEEIKRILQFGTIDELIILPLSVGEYHINWKYAQSICVELANHNNENVRANAALGLSYIARTKGKLEKHIVKPVLLKLLNECVEHKGRIIDSIDDINLFLKWNIAKKALTK